MGIRMFSKDWVRGHLENSANSGTVLAWSGNTEVSLLTPAGSPWVTTDPEIFTVFWAISDKINGMIKVGSTSWAAENTALVLHESAWSWGNSDRDGLFLHDCHVSIHITTWEWLEALNLCDSFTFVIPACFPLGNIWVALSRLVLDCLQIFIWVGHQTTTAASISVFTRAIENLLLGELRQWAELDLMCWLNCIGGRERITTSTRSLVSDWVLSTLLSPIERLGVTLKIATLSCLISIFWLLLLFLLLIAEEFA